MAAWSLDLDGGSRSRLLELELDEGRSGHWVLPELPGPPREGVGGDSTPLGQFPVGQALALSLREQARHLLAAAEYRHGPMVAPAAPEKQVGVMQRLQKL